MSGTRPVWNEDWTVLLQEGVALSRGKNAGDLVFTGPVSRLTVHSLSDAVADLLQERGFAGVSTVELLEAARSEAAPHAGAKLIANLRKLFERGFLAVRVTSAEQPLATAFAVASGAQLSLSEAATERWVMSRFALLRVEESALVAESPRSAVRVVLDDPRSIALLHGFAEAASLHDAAARVPGLTQGAAMHLVELFAGAGLLCVVDASGACDEETAPSLMTWEFHDLLFHTRSRGVRHDGWVGEAYRFAGVISPPPAVRPPAGKPLIDLARPDLELLASSGPTLGAVMEQRQSIREYGADPLTIDQLGELLYRVARIRGRESYHLDFPFGRVEMERTLRPYPSGGGLYELEFYAAVQRCRGLSPGLYRYVADGHQFEPVSDLTDDVQWLLDDAAGAAGIVPGEAQVLLILGARFQRLSWKYSGIAYALILKHVGAVYQSLYLAGTAMNLAPCAVGLGDPEAFARAIGSDFYEESSVGEFLIGSRA